MVDEAHVQTEAGTDKTDRESEIARSLRARFPDAIIDVVYAFGEETVLVRPDQNYPVLAFLRDDPAMGFDFLADVTAVDRLYLDEDVRFAVVYHLYSFPHKRRLRVKVPVPESDCRVESVAALWPTANWYEREVYDLFGITFDHHPDLRRILMPDDYGSHPLRKDYPLHGKGERDRLVF